VSFADLSSADAEIHRARVAADGPARLLELARLLTVDHVPIEKFDATIPSLGPLWKWFLGFASADFPGIPAHAEPRRYAVEPEEPEIARTFYAGELIAHYMFEVAKGCFREVAWVSNPNVGMDSYQRTAVQYVDDGDFRGLAHLDRYASGAILMIQLGETEYTDPDFLAEAFLEGPFLCSRATAQRVRALPRGPSVLSPILNRQTHG
jgi:hypothetical protein